MNISAIAPYVDSFMSPKSCPIGSKEPRRCILRCAEGTGRQGYAKRKSSTSNDDRSDNEVYDPQTAQLRLVLTTPRSAKRLKRGPGEENTSDAGLSASSFGRLPSLG
jgi:hypothetical protein